MKKNLIALITLTAMLASGTAAFAAEASPAPEAAPAESIEIEASADFDVNYTAANFNPSYISNTVTVKEITEERISTTTNTEDAENLENEINFTITDDTVVLDSVKGEKKDIKDIKKGDSITVFTGTFEPAPLILPPLYMANVVVINNASIDSLRFIDVDTYVERDGALVNLANTLELNIDDTVEIVDLDGKTVKADELANKDLAVFYMASTRSIPAQTTPLAVVVLGENERALAHFEAMQNTPEATVSPETTEAPEITDTPEDIEIDFSKITAVKVADETITNIYTDAEGNLMLPLRKIAEKLGFTVEWNGEMRAVILNGGIYSLQIGENSYNKGKMMPEQLSVAPEITNDLTYVPVDYFIEILETEINVNIDENSIEFPVVNE